MIKVCITAVAPSNGKFCVVALGLMSSIKDANTQVSDPCSSVT